MFKVRSIFRPIVIVLSITSSSFAGYMYSESRIWAAPGPGGYYGLVELEGTHTFGGPTVWRTEFLWGPMHFALPFRAPLALTIFVVTSYCVVFLLPFLVRRLLAHRSRFTLPRISLAYAAECVVVTLSLVCGAYLAFVGYTLQREITRTESSFWHWSPAATLILIALAIFHLGIWRLQHTIHGLRQIHAPSPK
jgi:hypothetical protein